MSWRRPMRKGDRVEGKFKSRRFQRGTIASAPVRDALAGRCCLVRWDDGSESFSLTRDLRRDFSDVMIPISALHVK